MDDLVSYISEANPDALFADGFDSALIGACHRFGDGPLALYDRTMCIQILIDRDGMSEDEAEDFFEFNVVGAWMGSGTPVFATLW